MDIWSTLDTRFMSIIVNNISFLWDSSKGFTILFNKHLFFPSKSFIHSLFFAKQQKKKVKQLQIKVNRIYVKSSTLKYIMVTLMFHLFESPSELG